MKHRAIRRSASFSQSGVALVILGLGGCAVDDATRGDPLGQYDRMSLAIVSSFSATFQQGANGYSGVTDAQLTQNAPTTNSGAANILLADGDDPYGSAKDASPVLRWDISSIPNDATVTSVTIRFQITDGSTNTYSIYPLLRAWSGSAVTWNAASSDTAWQTPGASGSLDRSPTAIGTVRSSTATAISVSLNAAGIAAVQSWITDPSQNFGIIIANSSNTDGLRLASSEHTTASYRPLLTINYTRDDGAGGAGTGGATGVGGAALGGGSAVAGAPTTGGTSGFGGTATSVQVIAVSDVAQTTSDTARRATAALLDTLEGTILLPGDANNMNGKLSEYNTYFAPTWGRHKARIRPAPGNHDYLTTNAQGYVDYFTAALTKPSGKTWYSFDVGGWHIISLDANCTKYQVGGCGAGSTEEKWLRSDLAANATKHCTIAYFHQPRFSSGEHGNNTSMQAIWQALAEYGVEMVISGHDHDYERFLPMDGNGNLATDGKGIVQFIVGIGGAEPRDFGTLAANSAARISGVHGVLKLTLRENGYDYAFVPVAGSAGSDAGSRDCYDP